VLSFFGDTGNSRKNYSRYVGNGIDQGSRPELVGGGLIRSMGAGLRFSPVGDAVKGKLLISGYSVTVILLSRSYPALMILLKRI
jgi:hypothetical protein